MHELAQWESFYVVIGAAAGALIGLQLVVMTLVADKPGETFMSCSLPHDAPIREVSMGGC